MELKKANPETIEMIEDQAKLMTSPELELLQDKIENLIEERDRLFLAQKLSKKELVSLYNSRGYSPKTGDKFWKVRRNGKGYGFYGWEVGAYEHSCHIDTTDLKVLLIIEPSRTNGGDTYVAEFSDMWLDGPIVV